MYKIIQEINFHNGSKIEHEVWCPNDRESKWNKESYGTYTCSKCGCKMAMRTQFKEIEVKNE